ncbi:MAG: tRNA (N(6)-L-threonylcarbamoyladenosine(37)-C(2))-methylthiotransferase MtaB [Phycisphaerae bacterium]
MRKYKIYTLGCKVAQAEGHQLRLLLDRFGLLQAAKDEPPDLCVVNTCAVTSTAAGKSRRLIFKLARLYPAGQIVLLGCYASTVDLSIRNIPQVVLIADHHRGITSALEDFLLQTVVDIKPLFSPKVKNKFKTSQSRHRAFLKIQDGCDANCTYCIIPQLRPKVHSLSPSEVIDQAKTLIQAGHQEIVLCGIFLGGYGKDTTRKTRFNQPGEPLADLITNLLAIPNLGRLRLSSLEPLDLTNELLKVLSSSDKVAGHLHLPLQSGSDNILRRMGRQYRSADYLQAVESAKKSIPNLALTTDIIVGFPGETDEDFQQTLKVSEKSAFAKIHIFPFSSRPGTPAAQWQNEKINPKKLESRLQILNDLEKTLALQFRQKFQNQLVRVLVEKIEPPKSSKRRDRKGVGIEGAHIEETGIKGAGIIDNSPDLCYCQGRADQYFTVRFPGHPEFDNQFHPVKIIQTDQEPLTGQVENHYI